MFLIKRSASRTSFFKFSKNGAVNKSPDTTESVVQIRKSVQKNYLLKDISVRVEQGCLESARGRIHIQPQLMDVLEVLINNSGQVVSRELLLEKVWTGKVVTEESLTRAISELRKALDDKPGSPRFIQTIPKKGYRLMCKVVSDEGSESVQSHALEEAQTSAHNVLFKPRTLAAVLVLSVIFVLGLVNSKSVEVEVGSGGYFADYTTQKRAG